MKRNLFYRLGERVAFWVMQWRMKQDTKKRDSIVSYWQAGKQGGGAVVELGYMKRPEAIRRVELMDAGPIVFIDDERSFIAFGNPPEPRQ